MTTTLAPPSFAPADALAFLSKELDLSGQRLKLANPEDGEAPSLAHADLMEEEYRKFLALRLAHPDEDIVPCKMVDEMWHLHILDTRAYADDCERIFGGFVHHFPYFGLRGADDAQALADAYEGTLERYRAAFGDLPDDTWISPEARRRCRTACKPVKCK